MLPSELKSASEFYDRWEILDGLYRDNGRRFGRVNRSADLCIETGEGVKHVALPEQIWLTVVYQERARLAKVLAGFNVEVPAG